MTTVRLLITFTFLLHILDCIIHPSFYLLLESKYVAFPLVPKTKHAASPRRHRRAPTPESSDDDDDSSSTSSSNILYYEYTSLLPMIFSLL